MLERRSNGDHRRSPGVHRLDDFSVIDALQVHGRDAEIAVAELTLNDHEQDAFVSKLDGMRVAQLMWDKAAPDTGGRRGVAQLRASG